VTAWRTCPSCGFSKALEAGETLCPPCSRSSARRSVLDGQTALEILERDAELEARWVVSVAHSFED